MPVPTTYIHRVRRAQISEADGFTLIELIIVMIIMAILMAAALSMMQGSKATANRKLATTTALSYKSAVDGFKLDHAGRVPRITAAAPATLTTDWSNQSQNELNRGPLEAINDPMTSERGRYVKGGVPEGISTGKVRIYNRNMPATLADPVVGGVVYLDGHLTGPARPTEYALVILTRARGGTASRVHCYVGSNAVFTALASTWTTFTGATAQQC